MKRILFTATIALAVATGAMAANRSATSGDASQAKNVKATVHADQAGAKINREIYGQFSEHLGSCIYGGLWAKAHRFLTSTVTAKMCSRL